jgi:cation:H+ antiporter
MGKSIHNSLLQIVVFVNFLAKRKDCIMALMLLIGILLLGLCVLGFAGDKTVDYGQQLAHVMGLNTLFLGFVLLAISTGLPELSVSITSLINGVPELSVGDIIGSNLVVVAFVLGVAVVLRGGLTISSVDSKGAVQAIVASFVLMFGVFVARTLNRTMGFLLILIYAMVVWFLWKMRHNGMHDECKKRLTNGKQKMNLILRLSASLLLVLASSELCVWAAIHIATATGVALGFIGSTIIAFGTSLPELILNISAVRRGDLAMAIGNSFGSVLEQGALILGILALFSPRPISIGPVMSVAPFMLFSYVLVGYGIYRYRTIPVSIGWMMIFTYITYLFFVSVKFI